MKLFDTNSSQRWAIGAVALALLFACSPNPEAPEPAKPMPENGPQLSAATPAAVNANPAVVAVDVTPPGYADDWAAIEADCADPAKTYKLSAATLAMTPDNRTCAVKSIAEDHPTGRSMIYTLEADCSAAGQATEDVVKFNFGASDTAMQIVLNDHEPIRVVRCP